MKKLLALLSLLVVALSNNISPAQSEDVPFTENSYYKGEQHTETDYKSMYNTYVGDKSNTDTDGCNTAPVAPKNPVYRKSEESVIWFILEGTADLNSLLSTTKSTTKLHAKDGDTIVAPFKVKIISSANSSNRGHKMIVESVNGRYRITFNDMSRWYCCKNREPKTDFSADFTHTKDAKGQYLSSGDIVGVATKDTTVLIEENVDGEFKTISTQELYGSN